jgi:hypothetical protein
VSTVLWIYLSKLEAVFDEDCQTHNDDGQHHDTKINQSLHVFSPIALLMYVLYNQNQ